MPAIKSPKQVKKKAVKGSVQANRCVVTSDGVTFHVAAISVRGAAPVNRIVTLKRGANLTTKQGATLAFIRAYHNAYGIIPSRREAQEALYQLGLTVQRGSHINAKGEFEVGDCSSINVIWKALEAKGELVRVLASGARGTVLAKDEKEEEASAIKLLRSLGYSVTKKKTSKKMVK